MKKWLILGIVCLLPTLALANEEGEKEAEIYHTQEEKRAAGLAEAITEHITISGLIEIEAFYVNQEFDLADDETSSDIELATAQVALEAELNSEFTGLIILDWDDDENAVVVDEATLDYARDNWFARFGLQYVPFGAFPSHFITGPITEELGETQETAIQLGIGIAEIAEIAVWANNGDFNEVDEDDEIDDFGVSLVLSFNDMVEVGGAYITDLADTDFEILAETAVDNEYNNQIGGWTAFAVLTSGPVALSGEYIAAADTFDPLDLDVDGDGEGDEPMAWNAEFSFAATETVELAVRYEGSAELADMPKSRIVAGFSWGFAEGMSLSGEYFTADYDLDFSSDALDTEDGVIFQLAAEF